VQELTYKLRKIKKNSLVFELIMEYF